VDQTLQAFLVISFFAAAHERAVEMIRKALSRLARRFQASWLNWINDALTIGSLSALTGAAFALLSNANALYLFRADPESPGSTLFFKCYLSPASVPGGFWSVENLLGCVLMGFAVALGSKFWHDLVFGLMDARRKLVAVKTKAPPPPIAPPSTLVEPAD